MEQRLRTPRPVAMFFVTHIVWAQAFAKSRMPVFLTILFWRVAIHFFVIIIHLSLQTKAVGVYFVALPRYIAGVYLILKPWYTAFGFTGHDCIRRYFHE